MNFGTTEETTTGSLFRSLLWKEGIMTTRLLRVSMEYALNRAQET